MRLLSFLGIVVFIVSLFLHLQTKTHPQLKFNSLTDRLTHPFDTRLRFRIDQVDPGFGLTRDEVIQLSQEAIQIWHEGTSRDDLMVYDENAQLAIQLIYDQRQQDYEAFKRSKKLLADEARYQREVSNLQVSQKNLEDQQQRLIQQKVSWNLNFKPYCNAVNRPAHLPSVNSFSMRWKCSSLNWKVLSANMLIFRNSYLHLTSRFLCIKTVCKAISEISSRPSSAFPTPVS